MIIRYLEGCKICLDSTCHVSCLQREQVVYRFCLCSSCIINFCMDALSVSVIYKTVAVAYEGDISPLELQTIYFF